jgi:hypothetical protein
MGVHGSHDAGWRNVDAEPAKIEDMEVFCAD